ncbi:MAG: DUF5686 and carboxypeptidase regulatory-like domain-containing protein [Sphingobacteriaceae bacterium]
MKLGTLFFFFLLSQGLLGQNLLLSGMVSDTKGQAIPFASVYVKGTTVGTSANSEGLYQLGLKQGTLTLIVRAVGYQPYSQVLSLNADIKLNFTLQPEAYQLNDVVIKADAEDPAYAIIRQVIKNRKRHLNEVKAYTAEVYIKGMQKLLAAPKKFMGFNIDELGKQLGLDSNRRGIIYLSESESKLSYQQPNQYREEMLSSKTSGNNRAFSFNRATDLKVNFYENYQSWDGLSLRPLVSPIAEDAFLYYTYKFLGNTVENGEMVNKIQVIPKRTSDPVFRGNIYILEDSWRIYSTDLYLSKDNSLNFVDTLKIKQDYIPTGTGRWMPASVKMEFTGSFLSFSFGGYFVAVFKNYQLEPSFERNSFKEALRITKEVNKKDSIYWERSRPIPLTQEETSDYQKKETLAAKRVSKPYLDSLDAQSNVFKPMRFLLGSGYTHSNRFKKEYLRFNSLLRSTFYNTVEGFGLNYGAAYVKQIDSLSNKWVRYSANVRYGFANQLINAHIGGSLPVGNGVFSFALGSDIQDLNKRGSVTALQNSISSLFFERNDLKLYQNTFAKVGLSGRILGNVRTSASIEFANRKSLVNTSSYRFNDVANRSFSSNNPLNPSQDVPLFPNNQSVKLELRASYNFSTKYVTYPTGKYYQESKYPTLGVNYIRGINGFLASDVRYDVLSADLAKSDIPMGFYGKSSFYIAAGKYLHTSSVFFPDYQHFRGNLRTAFQAQPNSFLFLEYYTHSTAGQFVEAHISHNFSGFIFNKIPLVRKLKLQELVGINYLKTPNLRQYHEWYAGVQWLNFKVLYGQSNDIGLAKHSGIRIAIGIN